MAAFLDNVCFDTIIADCQRQCLELFPPRSLRVQRPSFDSGNWGRVFHASIDGQHEPMVLKIMSWPLDNREFLAQQEAHSKMAHPTAPIRVPNVYYLFHPSYYMQPVPFAALLMDLIPDTRPTSRQSLAGESHIQATLRPAPNVHDLLLLLDVPGTLLHSPYKRYKLMHDILLAVQELLPLAHLDLLVPNILVQENADGSLLPAFIDWAFTAHLVSYNNSYEMTLMPHPQQDSPAQNDYRMMIGSLKGTMSRILARNIRELDQKLGRANNIQQLWSILQDDPAVHMQEVPYHKYIREHVPHKHDILPVSSRLRSTTLVRRGV